MGHKIADKILFVLVIGISIGFTWFVSGGISSTLIYNFVFLGIMILIYLFGLISGFGKMNRYEKAFQKELESEFKIRRSSVTSVIQGLEKHGLVERRSVSTDARQKELVLTEEGVRVQCQVIERFEEMEKRVNGWLSPEEREWWLRCVNKIETGLKEAEYD